MTIPLHGSDLEKKPTCTVNSSKVKQRDVTIKVTTNNRHDNKKGARFPCIVPSVILKLDNQDDQSQSVCFCINLFAIRSWTD